MSTHPVYIFLESNSDKASLWSWKRKDLFNYTEKEGLKGKISFRDMQGPIYKHMVRSVHEIVELTDFTHIKISPETNNTLR